MQAQHYKSFDSKLLRSRKKYATKCMNSRLNFSFLSLFFKILFHNIKSRTSEPVLRAYFPIVATLLLQYILTLYSYNIVEFTLIIITIIRALCVGHEWETKGKLHYYEIMMESTKAPSFSISILNRKIQHKVCAI